MFNCECNILKHPEDRIEISNCELSIRTRSCLRNNGIVYLDELTDLSFREVIQWKNFGRKSLEEVRGFLAKHGLSFKDETLNPDIVKMILHDLPNILFDLKKNADDAIRELRYFSYKIEQISQTCQKVKKKKNEH